MEEVRRAMRMAPAGDACQSLSSEDRFFSPLHEKDWAGELKTEEGWNRSIGQAISRAIVQGLCRRILGCV